MSLRQGIARVCTSWPVSWLLRPCWQGAAAIFLLHRFSCPEAGVRGTEPVHLRRQLAFLRQQGFSLLSLDDLCEGLAGLRALPARPVAYTIDDGYSDFHDVAAPIFAEFDCPATVFLATGFVDRECWLWWDQIEVAVMTTARVGGAVTVGETTLEWAWSDPESRHRAAMEIVEVFKRMPQGIKETALARLLADLEIALPFTPPPAYAPMTWDQVRVLESRGIRFGAHTVTHPILSRVPEPDVAQEIRRSVTRLDKEVTARSAVFCYPNGDPDSFGPRESTVLQDAGVPYAVSTTFAYARVLRTAAPGPVSPAHRIPRFALSDRWLEFRQIVSGFERVKQYLRSIG